MPLLRATVYSARLNYTLDRQLDSFEQMRATVLDQEAVRERAGALCR